MPRPSRSLLSPGPRHLCPGISVSPKHAPHAYLRPYCPSPEWYQGGCLAKSAQRESPARVKERAPPGRGRATGPCTRTERREGSFSKWPAGRRRTPPTSAARMTSGDPGVATPQPALKRKPATCSAENRTRNSPRVLSLLSGHQLAIRTPWLSCGGVTQQVRPHLNLPGRAPTSPAPGPAKSAATPRSATPPPA